MENSNLNKAHQQFRRAETLLKHRRFDEAAECHKTASEFLTEALKSTENVRSIESIKLQRDYHMRQRDIVLLKKVQYENYMKALENQKKKIQALREFDNKDGPDGNISLQWAIYRTMEETDSLLGLLVKKGSGANSDCESLKSFCTTIDMDDKVGIESVDGPNGTTLIGSKHPKDESIMIEELQILNEQLHTLVFQLVTQLDLRTKEVDMLKERVQQLEAEKAPCLSKPSNSLKVVTDSSGGTSPYVFSPCSELSPDVNDALKLPSLPPLEMPSFDIPTFLKSSSAASDAGF